MFLFLRKAALLLLALVLLTSALFVSCDQPEENPLITVEITSAADMAKIGIENTHPLNATYLLMNDITLENWLPIGDSALPFSGVFDGKGKTITLISFNTGAISAMPHIGIFAFVKGKSAQSKAVIKNYYINSSVNVESTSTSNGHSVGLAAGAAEMAEIDNITLSGTFSFSCARTIYAGGIAGYISGETIVKNCSSSLSMNIIPGTGGQPVTAQANMYPSFLAYSYAGGFAGLFKDGAGIVNCHNTGNVIADNTLCDVSGQVFTGGISGGSVYTMSTRYHGYITDSSSAGNITGKAKGSWTFAGGIAGTIAGNDTKIERCFAEGTISSAGTGSGWPYVGGIVGYNYYGALVSQCFFTGTVVNDKGIDYTGGIAGYNSRFSSANSRIEDCWSGGTVQGFNNAGGIVGQNQIEALVRRCYSTAEVLISGNAGAGGGGSGDSALGGIGGIIGMSASLLDNAITSCVALNPSITANSGDNIHRVIGRKGNANAGMSNNHAWSGITIETDGTYTEDIGADKLDGANIDTQKPPQSFYESLGWNFTNVWTIGTDGYPKLRWSQQ
ncbi:MAG: hypothetical protein FWB86_11640 [Treponema sp.]|nr:hypothetical protein [Treponema sp.]MCL2252158.1 hypothetical protein [Treponema sp.]